MPLLSRLERMLGRFAVPNITLLLVLGQLVLYMIIRQDAHFLDRIVLRADLVLQGELWRLVSFLFVPPATNVVFLFFGLYIFFLMGTALERLWGTFQYNLYLLISYLATVAASFIIPGAAATNVYIEGSVFLAFAFLYPDFVMYLFFLLPVKIKYIALVTWIAYLFQVVFGGWLTRLMVLAAVLNFLLFFGRDIYVRVTGARRKMAVDAAAMVARMQAFHRCAACGITEKTHPKAEFRYCSTCEPPLEYCGDHLRDHEHVAGK